MFITFEGPDGCGKTTQLRLLYKTLSIEDYSVLTTREPGGTNIGEQVRDVLHSRENVEMKDVTEILLYSASRAQLTREVIHPALQSGQIVLCDRYYDSTLAYQGYGRGLDLDMLRTITAFATDELVPDLTLYFDVDPEEGLRRRLSDGSAEWNRLDDEKLAFHRRVHAGYHRLINQDPGRWAIIDAAKDVQVVQQSVLDIVRERLAAHRT